MTNHPQRPHPPGNFKKAGSPEHRSGRNTAFPEPEVRRWPHPVPGTDPAACPELSLLQYVHCAMSYQNQLLADIRTQLEQLVLNTGGSVTEK